MDLSLVGMDALVNEIKKRAEHMVLAYSRVESGNEPIVTTEKSGKQWMAEVGLAEILKNDVLNNYGGELEKLHKIAEERIEDDKQMD